MTCFRAALLASNLRRCSILHTASSLSTSIPSTLSVCVLGSVVLAEEITQPKLNRLLLLVVAVVVVLLVENGMGIAGGVVFLLEKVGGPPGGKLSLRVALLTVTVVVVVTAFSNFNPNRAATFGRFLVSPLINIPLSPDVFADLVVDAPPSVTVPVETAILLPTLLAAPPPAAEALLL